MVDQRSELRDLPVRLLPVHYAQACRAAKGLGVPRGTRDRRVPSRSGLRTEYPPWSCSARRSAARREAVRRARVDSRQAPPLRIADLQPGSGCRDVDDTTVAPQLVGVVLDQTLAPPIGELPRLLDGTDERRNSCCPIARCVAQQLLPFVGRMVVTASRLPGGVGSRMIEVR